MASDTSGVKQKEPDGESLYGYPAGSGLILLPHGVY